jgi:hypothetical protein
MKRKWLGVLVLVGIAAALLASSSCARSQQLVSIAIQPASVTFLTPYTTLTFQLKAYGTYIHPPETKDITNKVAWTSAAPQLSTVTGTGVVATSGNGSCGTNQVTATFYTNSGNPNGNVVTGTATVIVDNPAITVCPH